MGIRSLRAKETGINPIILPFSEKKHDRYVYFIRILLEFNYSFKWVDDGAYGYKNKETGEWNGLMGELLSQVQFYWHKHVCYISLCSPVFIVFVIFSVSASGYLIKLNLQAFT